MKGFKSTKQIVCITQLALIKMTTYTSSAARTRASVCCTPTGTKGIIFLKIMLRLRAKTSISFGIYLITRGFHSKGMIIGG